MITSYEVPVSDADRIKAGLALHQVALVTGVAPPHPAERRRLTPVACRARRFAIYLAHIAYSWSIEHAGHAFGVNRSTAAAACRWAEDERDRRDVDEMLDRCEEAIRTLFSAPRCRLDLLGRPAR